MVGDLQLSARTVARLLASILGPETYDAPPFNGGDPFRRHALSEAFGPLPQPWLRVALNPQPLPPQELFAIMLADAHIREVMRIDRAAMEFGEGFAEAGIARSRQMLTEIEDWCPTRPKWPKGWPVPPRPPWEETMQPQELFMFGMRFLAAAEHLELGQLQEAATSLGEKAVGYAMEG